MTSRDVLEIQLVEPLQLDQFAGMADVSHLPSNLPPRLLDRRASAAYVGLSASKFDQLVGDGRMPRPKKIDRRRAWDIRALDNAIDDLPSGDEIENNPFDD